MFSQVHWYYNNDITSKLCCTYRNHAAIPKKNKNIKTKQNKTKQENKTKQKKTEKQNKTKQKKQNSKNNNTTNKNSNNTQQPLFTSQVEMLSGNCSK